MSDNEAKKTKPLVEPQDECTIPPSIPAKEVGKYSVARDPHAERDIEKYVQSQTSGEEIQHVEKMKTEYILGETFEVWDVTTDKNRWWVITNLTNLYPQELFTSLDYTLSFHIGLMRRIIARQNDLRDTEQDPFDEVSRRQEQAVAMLDRAIETEEFQAIGTQLRECLLSLIDAMRHRIDTSQETSLPKAADFTAWSDYLMDTLAPGQSKKALRKFLKSSAKETWQLVNWLIHTKSASQAAASIAAHSCDTLFGHFAQMLVREQTDNVEQCPRCSSRRLRSHFDIEIEPNGSYYHTCAACSWSSHPSEMG